MRKHSHCKNRGNRNEPDTRHTPSRLRFRCSRAVAWRLRAPCADRTSLLSVPRGLPLSATSPLLSVLYAPCRILHYGLREKFASSRGGGGSLGFSATGFVVAACSDFARIGAGGRMIRAGFACTGAFCGFASASPSRSSGLRDSG